MSDNNGQMAVTATARGSDLNLYFIGDGNGFATLEDCTQAGLSPRGYTQLKSASIAASKLKHGPFRFLIDASSLKPVGYPQLAQ